MKEVYVVESLRTPLGSFGGALSELAAPLLAAPVIRGLLDRAGLAADAVDQVIVGEVISGAVGQAPARQAMRFAGVPDSVPAMTINKVCGSGLMSIMLGAAAIRVGDSEVVIAGGMENMSQAPYALGKARHGYRMGNGEILDLMIQDGLLDPYSGSHMGVIAEGSATKHALGRDEQDAFALRSYRRAQQAQQSGLFKDEIVPVIRKTRKGEEVVSEDEEPFKVDFAKLPGLKPAFRKDGTITAGNASTLSDGAAMTLLAGTEALERYSLTPKARVVACTSHSIAPEFFAEAPVGAIQKVCAKAGLAVGEIDLLEINEAFAAVPLIAIKELGIDPERVNVNGGAVAIGHPLGASGARVVATLLPEMRRRGARYGLATLCIGGGEAVAVILERV